jgi:hypothetical protein
MFNSGIRGRRARDIEGILNPQIKYVQANYPIPTISGYTLVGFDDTALDSVGGQTVIVTGTNFVTGVSATVGGTQIGAVTLISPTQISFTTPAKSAGTYALVVYNSTGGAAILVPGMVYSSAPTYLTNSGSIASVYETNAINTSVSAPSDSTVTYTLVSGSLPTGATLNSNGTITGTAPLDASGTTYTFSIKATDAELQDVTRTFTITVNTDVVTWVTPTNGATINLDGTAYTQALSATSAAGKTVSYSADTLPTGLTLSGGVISGTPTVTQTISSVLTGTAATSTRTRTNSITWVVSVGDAFFKYTTLLLNGSTTNTTFLNDASTNNNQLTIYGDAKATPYTPYNGNYNSVYFPATGNYITIVNALHNVTAVNVTWTYESWIMPLTAGYFFAIGSGGTYGNSISVDWGATANKFRVMAGNGSSLPVNFTTTNTYTAGVWYHVAVTRTSGGIYTLYINGLADGTATYNAGTLATGTTVIINGCYDNNGLGNTGGSFYLSNMRFVLGSVVYNGNFTPSTTPLSAVTNTLLLTCQSNAFSDNSGYNQTLTRNNSGTFITPANPFGRQSSVTVNTGNSVYFNGSTNLSFPTNTATQLGTNNFTIELWLYVPTLPSTRTVIFYLNGNTSGYNAVGLHITSTNKLGLTISETGSGAWKYEDLTGVGSTLIANTWYHVAVVRNGQNIQIYLNGVAQGSPYALTAANSTLMTTYTLNQIGVYNTSNYYLTGYISNFRLVNGTAVYTSDFTPSTSPLTAITNTGLLTCQGTTIVDASTNAFTITPAGSPRVLNNTYPFTQTTATVSNVTTLGSSYFDGTGDYVTATTNPGFAFGATNDFTAECWVYFTTLNASQSPGIISVANSGSSTGWQIYADSNNGWGVRSNAANVFTVTKPPTVGQWYHVAYVRKSGVHALYVNGLLNTTTSSTSYTWSDQVFYSGYTPIGNTVYGFVADVRLVNGTALYTNNFVPTYQPLTAVTNTQLLTLQYNGGGNNSGIIDNGNLNHVITRYGNTSQGSFSPYSRTGWSTFFDGSTALSTSAAFNTVLPGLANNKVQMEMWIYPLSVTSGYGYGFLGTYAAVAANGRWLFNTDATGYLGFAYTTGTASQVNYVTTILIVANVWQHIAITIDATAPATTTMQIYYNGTPATVSTGNNMTTQTSNYSAPQISVNSAYVSLFNGFISNLRVLKNNFTYTGVFTPPTIPFVATQDTVLLCMQSNRLIDNAPNPSTITIGTGVPIIHAFSPFGSIREATPLTYGTYFAGGTSDFLTVATSAGQHNLSGDFTVEFWFYDMGTSKSLQQFAYSSTGGFACGINSFDGNAIRKLDWRVVGSAPIYGISAIAPYRWYHAAYVKSGSTFRIYLNGLLDYYNATYTNTFASTTTYIGAANNADANYSFNGYISNFRVIKTAIYTSTNTTLGLSGFTVPTTQLSATQSAETGIAAITGIPTNGNSVYFDGTGDYLITPNIGSITANFTIDFWYYPEIPTNTWYPYVFGSNTPWVSGIGMSYNTQTTVVDSTPLIVQVAGASITFSTFGSVKNKWNHVAIVRSSTTITAYLNGVSTGTLTNSATIPTTTVYIGGTDEGGSYDNHAMKGYISNFRIVNGVALYTGTFTVPASPLSLTQSAGTNIVALTALPTNGNSVYFDGTGDWLTLANNAAFVFAAGDFTVELWVFLTSTSGTVANYSNGQSSNSNFSWELYQVSATTIQFSVLSGATQYSASSAVFVTGAWRHIACVRNGNTLTIYVNGVAGATTVSVTGVTVSEPSGSTLKLGSYGNGSGYITGYMSNLRIVKGTAVYTSAFTPSTTPLTAVSGTTLLTCQATSFVDNSVNNLAITPTGDVRVITSWSPFGFTPQLLACQATRLVDNSNNNFIITAVGNVFANKTFSPFGFAPQLLTCQSSTTVDNSSNQLTITAGATPKVFPNNPLGYTNNSALMYTPSVHSGSTYHDGSGDYLAAAANNILSPSGTSPYTFECWFYIHPTASGSGNYGIIMAGTANSSSNCLGCYVAAWSTLYIYNGANLASTAVSKGIWYHVAVSRVSTSSNSTFCFLNGTLFATVTDSSTYTAAAWPYYVGTSVYGALNNAEYFNGYISDVRYTKTALYTNNFYPPATTLTNQISTANQPALKIDFTNAGITDLHGTNNLESLGNTGLSPEDPLLGNYYSNYFDGTGDYLATPSNIAFAFGTGDYTMECWIYPTTSAGMRVFEFSSNSDNVDINSSTGTVSYYNGSTSQTSAGGLIVINTWTHIATVRSSGTVTVYVNGVLAVTQVTTPNTTTARVLYVAGFTNTLFVGYISNVRMVKGVAVYTGTFTKPTGPLTVTQSAGTNITAITGTSTSLLTCQSNTFKDNSSNAFAITKNGDVSVRTFNPFQRNTGRSISFPIAGSYLMVSDSQNIRLGTGDFTIDCWFYLIGNSTDGANLFSYNTSGTTFGIVIHTNLTSYANKFTIWIDQYGTGPFITGTATIVTGQWNFFALTRASGVWKLWLNGAQDGSNYTNAATPDRNLNLRIGGDNYNANRILNGYTKDFRITKGYARYTTAFTNPTTSAPGL